MKESSTGGGCLFFVFMAPMVILGAVLLIWGLRTSPEALTDDGLSQRTFLLVSGTIFLVLGLGIAFFSLAGRASARAEELDRQRLSATHREGAARIERVQRGTQLGNEHWVPVQLTLEVVLPGKAPYEVIWDGQVEQVFTGQLRPNEWLRVMVSPSAPQELHISWGEAPKVPPDARR